MAQLFCYRKDVRKISALLSLVLVSSVFAANESGNDVPIGEIAVVGVTPVPGMSIDADKVPGNVQTLKSSDLNRNGTVLSDTL